MDNPQDVIDGKHLISKEEIIGNNKLFITIDIEITDILKKEGIVNDLIRSIQDIRKSHNLKISQLCNIYINTDNNLINSIIKENMELLLKSVNAKNIKTDKIIKGNIIKINDIDIEILIQ